MRVQEPAGLIGYRALGMTGSRQDANGLLALAPQVPVRTDVHPYALSDAGRALEDLRAGRFQGAAVINVDR